MQIGRFVEMGVVVMTQLRGCFIRVCRYCQSERLIGSKLKKVLSELEHKSFQVGCVDKCTSFYDKHRSAYKANLRSLAV